MPRISQNYFRFLLDWLVEVWHCDEPMCLVGFLCVIVVVVGFWFSSLFVVCSCAPCAYTCVSVTSIFFCTDGCVAICMWRSLFRVHPIETESGIIKIRTSANQPAVRIVCMCETEENRFSRSKRVNVAQYGPCAHLFPHLISLSLAHDP